MSQVCSVCFTWSLELGIELSFTYLCVNIHSLINIFLSYYVTPVHNWAIPLKNLKRVVFGLYEAQEVWMFALGHSPPALLKTNVNQECVYNFI